MAQTIKICGLSTAETRERRGAKRAPTWSDSCFSPKARAASAMRRRARSPHRRAAAPRSSRSASTPTMRRWTRSWRRPSPITCSCTGRKPQNASRRSSEGSAFPPSRRSASPTPRISRRPTRTKASADALLIDAKPPKGAVLPGGNGMPSIGGSPPIFIRENPGCCRAGSTPTTSRRRSRFRGTRGGRRVVGRRERAGRQGHRQNQGVRRSGARRVRARRIRSCAR